jgi:hypothetical protein
VGRQLFTAMIALVAIARPALGGDESVPRTGTLVDTKPGADAGVPCDKTDSACGSPTCFWLRGEALLWWTKNGQVPPLITTGVPGSTALPGVLGQPGTTVLFGGSDADDQVHAGGRVGGGFWFNDCHSIGLEGNYLYLASRSVRFDGSSSGALGSAMIARPFFDVIGGTQNAQLVAYPGIASGEIHLTSSSRLQGAELNVLGIPWSMPRCDANQDCCAGDSAKHNTNGGAFCGGNFRVSLLGGFRYLQLDEDLGIT